MTTVVIAPESLIFLSIAPIMRGRHPSALDRQLRQAPIIKFMVWLEPMLRGTPFGIR
jgi:hypothetical protein